jgi:transcriptional regulator with XRE-family HTH domain
MSHPLNEILKSLREKHRLSLENLAHNLKTTVSQIEILEKGEFKKIPYLNLKRILEKYEIFFKLKEGELLGLINKVDYFQENQKLFKSQNTNFFINFNFYFYLFFSLIILAVIFFQLTSLLLPPQIKIIYPPDGLITNKNIIVISGYTDKRSSLFINNEEVLYDEKGYFSKTALLKTGLNKFEFLAKNYWGLKKKIIINVYFQP